MNIRGQGHSLTFVEGHSDSTFSNFFSLETAKPIEAKFDSTFSSFFFLETAKPVEAKFYIFFSGTKMPMTLKLGMWH